MRQGIKFSTDKRMISARGEIQDRTFLKIQGKAYTWYVADVPNKGDYIYVGTENKEGMGGATCCFELVDGSVDKVEAPWRSNSGALLEDTGIDYTDRHLISYIIAEDRESIWGCEDTYYGVLELIENELMCFDEYVDRAKYFANKLRKDVYVTRVSTGGSCMGMESPDKNHK